jgi:hypothetical protein
MKLLKQGFLLLILSFVMASFSQCSSIKSLQEKAPTNFGEVYCQTWVAGARGGGSGINIYIPVKDLSVKLDSVYFRGKRAKLKFESDNNNISVGRILTDLNNEKHDMMMSSDAKQEYGNKLPKIPEKIPFELQNNECVVSYIEDNTTKYFKIENVTEKPLVPFPSAPNGQ